ncbi:MAG: DMT family transporter [Solirubrobacterales bacterium]
MNTRAWVAFAVLAAVWGTPYLLIKVAVDGGMPPLVLAWVRLLLAMALLAAIAWRAGSLAPLRPRLRWIALYALFELVIPFPMLGFGEERIDSSVAAILIATAPLIVAVLALRFEPSERVRGRRLAGLLIGLIGVAALVGVHLSGGEEELLGVGAVFVAATGYAIGPMILRRHFADLDPIASMAAAMAFGALALTPFAAAALPGASPSGGAIASVLALAVFCTALSMVAMAILVREAGAGRALLVTYVNPVIAVALGVIFLSEEPGAGALAGLAAILAGSWLASRGEPPAEIEPDAVVSREQVPDPG